MYPFGTPSAMQNDRLPHVPNELTSLEVNIVGLSEMRLGTRDGSGCGSIKRYTCISDSIRRRINYRYLQLTVDDASCWIYFARWTYKTQNKAHNGLYVCYCNICFWNVRNLRDVLRQTRLKQCPPWDTLIFESNSSASVTGTEIIWCELYVWAPKALALGGVSSFTYNFHFHLLPISEYVTDQRDVSSFLSIDKLILC